MSLQSNIDKVRRAVEKVAPAPRQTYRIIYYDRDGKLVDEERVSAEPIKCLPDAVFKVHVPPKFNEGLVDPAKHPVIDLPYNIDFKGL